MNTKSLLRQLASYYPQRLRESYDFGGLMVGTLPKEVHSVFLCLDFDDEVLPEVLKVRPDLIITHHPFFFGTRYRILKSDPVKAELYEKMLKEKLCLLSYHTNFDAARSGMNDELAEKLGLIDVKPLETAPMARGGKLEKPMEIRAFARYAKERLGVSYGLLIAAGKPMISSVAMIGGGGWMENVNAQAEGYDIYLSGDCPHHGRREIVLRHYNYLDLPHEIEKAFMTRMTKTLLNIDLKLTIISVDHEKLPEVI
jgi:dinuclear metal center protein, YbgI/SA1388 family